MVPISSCLIIFYFCISSSTPVSFFLFLSLSLSLFFLSNGMDFVLSDVVPAKQLTGYLLPVTEHFSRPIQPQYRISDTSRKRYKLRNETIAPVSRFFVTANPSCSTIATTDQPSCRHLDSPLNMVSAYLNGYLVGFLDLGMWVDEEPCIDFLFWILNDRRRIFGWDHRMVSSR